MGVLPSCSAVRIRVVALGVVLLAVVVSCAAVLRHGQEARYDGEHGLAVHLPGDSVVAKWVTSGAQAGRLEVVVDGRVVVTVRTATGFSHRAAFPLPHAAQVLLRYGGDHADAPRFETAIILAAPERAAAIVEAVDSIYVIGDTHGMYDAFVEGMQRAGLLDDSLRWSGGRRHLVLAGDLMGRGPDVTGLLWLIYRLEREALAAGGAVHVVLGNHEIMVMLGDLRYVHPKETEIASLHGVPYDRMFDIRHSVLGRWLASKPGALRIGDAVITHGGLDPYYARLGMRALDDTLRSYMSEELFYFWADTTAVIPMDSASFARRDDFFWSPRSLFWHREYVQSDSLDAELEEALRSVDARVLVVGHTPVDTIHARYGGRLLASHTLRYGAELLLLVRDGDAYRRYRITADGKASFEE